MTSIWSTSSVAGNVASWSSVGASSDELSAERVTCRALTPLAAPTAWTRSSTDGVPPKTSVYTAASCCSGSKAMIGAVRQGGVHVERELSPIGTDVDHVARLQTPKHRLWPVRRKHPRRAAWRPSLVVLADSTRRVRSIRTSADSRRPTEDRSTAASIVGQSSARADPEGGRGLLCVSFDRRGRRRKSLMEPTLSGFAANLRSALDHGDGAFVPATV